MATIPTGQKFHTVPSNVQTVERGSALANSQREIYTMQDIVDTTRPYKVYTALFVQSGASNPIVNILENTLTGDITWTRDDVGVYLGILTGEFTLDKTFSLMTLFLGSLVTINSFRSDEDTFVININELNSPNNPIDLDGVLQIEIRVYN
jgi:hypothetical protein